MEGAPAQLKSSLRSFSMIKRLAERIVQPMGAGGLDRKLLKVFSNWEAGRAIGER